MDQPKPIAHVHTYMAGKFNGRCTPAPFRAINHDGVGGDVRVQPSFYSAKPLLNLTHAHIDTNGLAFQELAKLSNNAN